jgi:hypothetical protein
VWESLKPLSACRLTAATIHGGLSRFRDGLLVRMSSTGTHGPKQAVLALSEGPSSVGCSEPLDTSGCYRIISSGASRAMICFYIPRTGTDVFIESMPRKNKIRDGTSIQSHVHACSIP